MGTPISLGDLERRVQALEAAVAKLAPAPEPEPRPEEPPCTYLFCLPDQSGRVIPLHFQNVKDLFEHLKEILPDTELQSYSFVNPEKLLHELLANRHAEVDGDVMYVHRIFPGSMPK